MPVEDEFVEVGGLLGSQAMESLVIEDGQVGREERPQGAVCRVVRSGLCHSFEEVVGVDETDIVSGADGSVAQGLSEEALADTCRSHQEDVLEPVEKLQGEDGVQQTAIRIASNPMLPNFGRTRSPGGSSHETRDTLDTVVGKTRHNASENPIGASVLPASSALLVPSVVRPSAVT